MLRASVRRQLRRLREEGGVELHERVDLRAWTALRVGGPADLLIRCHSLAVLQRVLECLAAHGVPWLVLGSGASLVPSDSGLRIPALSLAGELARWELELDGVVAGGGAVVTQLVRAVVRAGLSGLECLEGAGGTAGGVVVAGLAGRAEVSEPIIDWFELVRPGLPPLRRRRAELGDLRDSRAVVTRVRFALVGERPAASAARLERLDGASWRRGPGVMRGVFRNPPAGDATELLAAAGCQGLVVGAARVDERDPNTIVASRGASARDVADLCSQIASRVAERAGLELLTRLVFVDELGREVEA